MNLPIQTLNRASRFQLATCLIMLCLITRLSITSLYSQDDATTKAQKKAVQLSGASGSVDQTARKHKMPRPEDFIWATDPETEHMLREMIFAQKDVEGWDQWRANEILDDCNTFQTAEKADAGYSRIRCLERHNLGV